jgi:hypothetical protein
MFGYSVAQVPALHGQTAMLSRVLAQALGSSWSWTRVRLQHHVCCPAVKVPLVSLDDECQIAASLRRTCRPLFIALTTEVDAAGQPCILWAHT